MEMVTNHVIRRSKVQVLFKCAMLVQIQVQTHVIKLESQLAPFPNVIQKLCILDNDAKTLAVE